MTPSTLTREVDDGDAEFARSEFEMSSRDFKQIAETLHAESGIFIPESKTALVYSRLAKRLRALGLQSFRDYCSLISGDDGVEERQRMIAKVDQVEIQVAPLFRDVVDPLPGFMPEPGGARRGKDDGDLGLAHELVPSKQFTVGGAKRNSRSATWGQSCIMTIGKIVVLMISPADRSRSAANDRPAHP